MEDNHISDQTIKDSDPSWTTQTTNNIYYNMIGNYNYNYNYNYNMVRMMMGGGLLCIGCLLAENDCFWTYMSFPGSHIRKVCSEDSQND